MYLTLSLPFVSSIKFVLVTNNYYIIVLVEITAFRHSSAMGALLKRTLEIDLELRSFCLKSAVVAVIKYYY